MPSITGISHVDLSVTDLATGCQAMDRVTVGSDLREPTVDAGSDRLILSLIHI